MDKNLWPVTLTRKISDIHAGGFSMEEEKALGFKEGELFKIPKADNTSFDIFNANIAMKTRYIRLIIFCLGVNFPPAIFSN